MDTANITWEISKGQDSQAEFGIFPNLEQYHLLQGVLESLVDGILIVTEEGQIIQANQTAKRICNELNKTALFQNRIPSDIWRICQSLIESKNLFPDRKIVLESEIVKDTASFRLRVQWFELKQMRRDGLLVTIEDKSRSLREMVTNDAHQYDLTPREAEVWLLYRANHSYKEIAEKLFITLNTVKKHMKNIHAKRKAMFEEEE